MEQPEKMSLADIKITELSILDYVVSICNGNNLSYYLAYGTLIGAIRHKGFIPWDDDIDIVMPRPDYERFIAIARLMCNSKYRICIPNEDGFYYEFVKVIDTTTLIKEEEDILDCPNGVWIDIFPLDGLRPKDKLNYLALLFGQRCRVAAIYNSFPHKMNILLAPIEWVMWKFCKIIGFRAILSKTIKLSQKYTFEDCEHIGYASSVPAYNKFLKKEWFQDGTLVEFEGRLLRAPKQYHEYLTTQYGDYMQLPPMEKRVCHHISAYRTK